MLKTDTTLRSFKASSGTSCEKASETQVLLNVSDTEVERMLWETHVIHFVKALAKRGGSSGKQLCKTLLESLLTHPVQTLGKVR